MFLQNKNNNNNQHKTIIFKFHTQDKKRLLFQKTIYKQQLVSHEYLRGLHEYRKTCICMWKPIVVKLTDMKKNKNNYYIMFVKGRQYKQSSPAIPLLVVSQHSKRLDHDIKHNLIKSEQLVLLKRFVCTKVNHKVVITLISFKYVF